MRKLSLLAAATAAALASPAFAANEGAYAGMGITHDNVATGGDVEGVGFNGVGGTVFAGYKIPVGEKAYTAVEANFDIMSAKVGDEADNVKANHSFGASALLGFNLNDSTSLFGRIGYQRGRETTTIDSEEFAANRDGLRFGAGLETKLTESLSLRGEYSRTHYYLSAEDKAEIEPLKSGVNNDQFAISIVAGF